MLYGGLIGLMRYRWLVILPLLAVLILGVACSGEDVEVTREVVVTKEVPGPEVVVTREVPVDRIVQVVVTAVPVLLPGADVRYDVTRGKYGGTPNFAIFADPGILDMHAGGSTNSSFIVSNPRFNQLVEFNPVNYSELVGELAQTWEVSSDGLTYTFHIHPDANWHDGKPVTAEDVKFSLDRIADPDAIRPQAGPAVRPYYAPGTAKVVDQKTIEVPLIFPSAAFLTWMAYPLVAIYPKHFVEGKTQEELNCCYENLMGSGPWMLDDFKRGTHIKWEKNPNYWRKGLPFWDGYNYFKIEDPNTVIANMNTGQIMAWATIFGEAPQGDAYEQLWKDTSGAMVPLTLETGGTAGLILNVNGPVLQDVRVRKAIMLALDRVEFIKTIWKGFGRQGTFFAGGSSVEEAESTWPGWRYVDADGKLITTDPVKVEGAQKHPDDITAAQRLMEEAGAMGYKGNAVMFNIPGWAEIGVVAAKQMKKYFNWDIEARQLDVAAAMDEAFAGRFDFAADGSVPTMGDPTTMITQLYLAGGGVNYTNWSDARIEKLADDLTTATTPEERKRIALEIEAILRDDAIPSYIPIRWFPYFGAMSVKIRNFHLPEATDAASSQEIIAASTEHWWLDPDAKPEWGLGP